MKHLIFGLIFGLSFTSTLSARETTLSKPYRYYVGSNVTPIILDTHFDWNRTKENVHVYRFYDADYRDVLQEIKAYRGVYFAGQVLHGGLLVGVKSKFLDQ